MRIDRIFELARAKEFQPFSLITNSGTRYHIRTRDHISIPSPELVAAFLNPSGSLTSVPLIRNEERHRQQNAIDRDAAGNEICPVHDKSTSFAFTGPLNQRHANHPILGVDTKTSNPDSEKVDKLRVVRGALLARNRRRTPISLALCLLC
jgi:hypothetical protein